MIIYLHDIGVDTAENALQKGPQTVIVTGDSLLVTFREVVEG